MRRAARLLGIHQITVARKMMFLAEQARLGHARHLEGLKFSRIQFDDLETSEHTKCKPLSVSIAVCAESRKILSFRVSQMPAKGKLAAISRAKYGFRADHRPNSLSDLFEELKNKNLCQPDKEGNLLFVSDQNPLYPTALRKHFSHARHETHLSRRGCVVGQGELKKIGFDPLFSLNHTCAMLRANMNRLFRRTWCTTKKARFLFNHISIYAEYHNRVLT